MGQRQMGSRRHDSTGWLHSGRYGVRLLLCVTAIILAVWAPARAQQTGTIAGVVTDALGARVPGAALTVSGEGSQARQATSGADGTYTVDGLSAGRYQVTATAQGFQPATSASVYVGGGQRQTIDLSVQIGPLTQDVVVTASATQVLQSQTGAPVTVLDEAALTALNKPDVLEALRQIPGAQVVQVGARGGTTSLFIRGGNPNFNKVLIDGAVANDIGGAFDFAQLSTVGVERVEVMRQTNSVTYGADAMAGVVSLTTRRGRTRTPEGTLSLDGGNLGTWSSEGSVGGVARRFDYFSSYRHFDTDNDVANNGFRNDTYAGRVGVALGGGTDLSGTLRVVRTDQGSPNATALYGLSDDANSKADLIYGTVTANSQISNRWQTTVRFGSTGQTTHYLNPSPSGEAYDPFGFGANYLGRPVTVTGGNGYAATGRAILDFGGTYPSVFDARTTRRTLTGQTSYQFGSSLTLSGGARIERESGVTCSTAGCLDTVADSDVTSRNNGGAFVEARAALGNRHYVTAGLGVEHNEVFGNEATPRLSVASYLRQPSTAGVGETKLVLNAGTGIKAPSVFQAQSSLFELVKGTPAGAGVEPVGPERSRNFDVGIEQAFAGSRARVRVAYFHNTFDDLLEFLGKNILPRVGVPVAAANATPFGAYVNSQSYRAQGAEVSVEAAPRRDLRVLASYTRLDAEVTQALSASRSFNPAFPGVAIGAFSPLVGERPFRRPANSGSLMVLYTPDRLELALSAYFSGVRDDSTFLSDQDFGDSLLLPNQGLDKAYQKVDLSAAYQVHPRLRTYVSIENLFDQTYQAAFGYPALPLTARVGLRVTFGGDGPRP